MAENVATSLEDNRGARCDDAPRTLVPPAFYRDDEPPEPPDDEPHRSEFPLFEAATASRLLVAGIVLCVCFATLVHLSILLFI